jgi:hypothetical protein
MPVQYLEMDLFIYNPTYQIWICIHCCHAVTPRQFNTHLRSHHRHHPAARTAELRQAALAEMLKQPYRADAGAMQIPPTGLCAYSRPSRLPWLTLPLLLLCVAIVSDTAQASGTHTSGDPTTDCVAVLLKPSLILLPLQNQ